MVPRLLVVPLLRQRRRWLEQGDEWMVSRYAAHYVSSAGAPETNLRGKVPVLVPRKNLLSVDNLRRLITQASQRKRKLL